MSVVPLNELITFQRGFDLSKSKRKDGVFPVIASTSINGFHNKYKVQGPGVVIGRSGSIGGGQYIKENFWPLNTTLWIKDFKGHNPQYIYYLLKNTDFSRLNAGVGVPTLNRNHLSNIKVVDIELDKENQIASTLSAYDDLIENNRRRIQLLEKAARLLYKEWFVRLRFPGHEKVRIVDGVPEGWEKSTLGKALNELESGGRPKGGAQNTGIPSIGAENVIGIGQYDYSKEKYVSEDYFQTMRRGVVQNRDVVVYKDGANIGRSSYFGDGFPHEKCSINEHVFILRSTEEIGQNWLYFWIERDDTRQRLANLNANTAQPGISQGNLLNLHFVKPPKPITKLFNDTVDPIVRQIFLLAKENQVLARARDLLLPRLMSGKIVVNSRRNHG